MSLDNELSRFKQEINISHFLAAHGYKKIAQKSGKTSTAMKGGMGDILITSKALNGNYIYFSVADSTVNSGSILDYCERHISKNLGEIRKYLRPWISNPPQIDESLYTKKFEAVPKNLHSIKLQYSLFEEPKSHDYLQRVRGITDEIIHHSRFKNRIKIDGRNGKFRNVVFPHYTDEGLSGYESKGRGGFSHFSTGGLKAFWFSRTSQNDNSIILFESVVDALSFAQLYPKAMERSLFASVGGRPSPKQQDLFKLLVGKLSKYRVYFAFDNDKGGDDLTKLFGELLPKGRIAVRLLPGYKDWNDVLLSR